MVKRHRVIAVVLGFILSAAAGAAAAWFIVSLNGSGAGHFGSATPLTITATASPSTTACLPGATCDISFSTSNTSGTAFSLTTLVLGDATATGAPAGCTIPAGSFTLNAGQLPLTIPTGSQIFHVTVTANAGLPSCLSGASFTIPVTGSGS